MFWRDPKGPVAAVTFALLELFSLGAVTMTFHGIRYPAPFLPWHWLAGRARSRRRAAGPVLHSRGRRSGCVARVRPRPGARAGAAHPARAANRTGRDRGRGPGHPFPLSPCRYLPPASASPRLAGRRPLPGCGSRPTPTCWSSPTYGCRCAGRRKPACPPPWSAGGATVEPGRTGQATSYIYNRLGPPSTSTAVAGAPDIGHRPRRRSARILRPGRWPRSSPPPAGTRPSRAS